MKIRCAYSELVKASTPDWGTSPGCQKLKAAIREIYDRPCPWPSQPDARPAEHHAR